MSILTESNVPQLILQLNAIQKQINYRGITRDISDTYWKDEIGPRLYPNWDSDKDRLVQLNYYDNGSFHAKRRKFVKNFSTNEYEWRDYEMETYEVEEAKEIFSLLKEAFYLIESVEKENFQKELAEAHYQANTVSWFGIRLVRQFLLEDSDWVFMPDSPISEENLELWKTYRIALRNIPQVDEFVEASDVLFPISPEDYNTFYKPENPDEEYLGTPSQYLKLSGYFISHYKERVIQYLIIKQSFMSPLNYKSYSARMENLTANNSAEIPIDTESYVDSILVSVQQEIDQENSVTEGDNQ
jgi:hypothetical protein